MRALVYGVMNPDIVHELDVLPQPGDDLRSTAWHITWGGKAANVAATLAALGVDTRLLGLVIGTDPLGDALLAALARPRLDLRWVQRNAAEATRHCVIMLSPDGDRTIVCSGYTDAAWQSVPEEAWTGVDVLVLDGFGGAAAAGVAAEATRRGVAAVWLDAPDPPPVAVDLVVWSHHEHMRSRAAEVGTAGQDLALTAGADDVEAWIGGAFVALTPPGVEPRDATGAGDAFAAGAADALGSGEPLPKALRWAAAVGAAVASRGRGNLPSSDDARALLDS